MEKKDFLNFTKCILCQKKTHEPTQYVQKEGLRSLRKNLEDNNFISIYPLLQNFDIRGNDEIILQEKPVIHKSCRRAVARKRKRCDPISVSVEPKQKRSDSLSSPSLKMVCFLCEKERTIYKKKRDRNLILVSTIDRQRTIHEKAKQLQDTSILTKIQGFGSKCVDMVAYDFRYHRSCMSDFLNRKPRTPFFSSVTSSATMSREESVLQSVFKEVDDMVVTKKQILLMSYLYKNYQECLQVTTDGEAQPICIRTLKSKIAGHFGSKIRILSKNGKPDIVTSSRVSLQELWSQNEQLKDDVDDSQITGELSGAGDSVHTVPSIIFSASKHIRALIRQRAKEQRTENQLDLSNDYAMKLVPVELYNMLSWIMSDVDDFQFDCNGRVQVNENVKQKALSISQDIMSASTRISTPKNTALALHILKQTRSKDTVTMLNRFGHAISYDDAQRHITSEADKVDDNIAKEGIFIPPDLKEDRFTQMAFDNLDFSNVNKDGSSFHATTHVVFQYKGESRSPVKSAVSTQKGRRKSCQPSEAFCTQKSCLTIHDRRAARSVNQVLPDDDLDHDANIYEFEDEIGVWLAMKMLHLGESQSSELEKLPALDSFLDALETRPSQKTLIQYGPIFPESPTKPDVVKASLEYFQELSRKLGQRATVVTCDQAIYDIAKALITKARTKYPNVILRLGGFHIAENFLKAIGSFMQNSGLENLLSESGLCGPGTAKKVLSGKDYYQMLSFHSTAADAMLSAQWKVFEAEMKNSEINDALEKLAHVLPKLKDVGNDHQAELTRPNEIMEECRELLQVMKIAWKSFQESLGATAKFWNMYIQMVLILRRYIHAERCGHWHGHLIEVRRMLPYLISAGHRKYASCVPIYLKDMEELPDKYPEVYEAFLKGNFTVHHTSGFHNGVWTDMAIEQSYNKEGKTTLFKGIVQSAKTRDKYIKTVPYMSNVSQCAKTMANMLFECERKRRYDSQFSKNVLDEIELRTMNPFATDDKDSLANIVTGITLPDQTALQARELGEAAIGRAQEKNSDAIEIPKIMTFKHLEDKGKKSKSQVPVQSHEVENKAIRAMCLAQSTLPLHIQRETFKYEWTPYPVSLFEADRRASSGYSMRKGVKSNFVHAISSELGEHWIETDKLPTSESKSATIIDAMAFIQRHQAGQNVTFGELSTEYLNTLLSTRPPGCCILHVVGDRYDIPTTESLKQDERMRRDGHNTLLESRYAVASQLKIPEWKSFISSSQNKANLLEFLSVSWKESAINLSEIKLFLGGMCKDSGDTLAFTNGHWSRVESLSCEKHEEADTRMMAHLYYCSQQLECERIIVESADTDVLLLCMYHFARLNKFCEVFVHRGGKYVHIHTVVRRLAEKFEVSMEAITAALLSAFALTGCDTVSYPFRRGKKKAANIIFSSPLCLEAFSEFEEMTPNIEGPVLDEARNFMTRLYNKENISSLNTLRQHIFAQNKSELRSLPPTEDAFKQHVLRALYQFRWWKQANKSNPNIPSVTDFGRNILNNYLVPITTVLPQVPPDLDVPSFCKCKSSMCQSSRCSCVKADIMCTIACVCATSLHGCSREEDIDEEESESDEDF